MLVLALDTSTPAITAGVLRLRRPHELVAETGGPAGLLEPLVPLARDVLVDQFGHAEQLMPLITRVLATADVSLSELEAVVVGVGPGPYTGLRVGIATAQALGDGCGIAVHPVPSHDGVARAVPAGPAGRAAGDLLVVTDARRREVYLSAYRADGSRLLGPQVLAPSAVAGVLAEHAVSPALIAGRGAGLLAGHLHARPDESAVSRIPDELLDLTLGLTTAAARALATGAVPGPLTPLYLRRPDATEPAVRRRPG